MAEATELIVDTRKASEACAALTATALDGLAVGQSFVLVADHDPVGLKYMLAAEQPGVSSWEDLESGPDLWRARISRLTAKA